MAKKREKKNVMEGHTYICMYGEVRVYASTYTTVREGGGGEAAGEKKNCRKINEKKQHTSLVACA